MRRTALVIFTLIVAAFAPLVHAQSGDPSELFLNAYMSVQQAEKLELQGNFKTALSKYRYAASLLDQVHEQFPTWQPLIVDYRRKRTTEAIGKLQEKIGFESPGKEMPTVQVPEPTLPESQPQVTTDSSGEPAPAQTVLPAEPQLTETPAPFAPAAAPSPATAAEPSSKAVRKRLQQLQTELEDSRKKLSDVQKEKEALTNKLNETLGQLKDSKTGQVTLKARLAKLQEDLKAAKAETAKVGDKTGMLAEIARLKKALRDTQDEREVADEESDDVVKRLSGARQLVKTLTKERDSAKDENNDLNTKLADARKQVESLTQERDTIAKQRDDAVSQLAKAKEAQQQVDKLLADNSALMQKLTDAESTIAHFKADAPKKDQEIASLKKGIAEAQDKLATANQTNQDNANLMAALQSQLDAASAQIVQLKASGDVSAEKKKMVDENELLRGIVMRQLKEEANRAQTRKLVLQQLSKLKVQSSAINQQIQYLGSPVVKLTAKEKALFKQPHIEVADLESKAMEMSISAPKAEEGKPAEPAQAQATPSPEPTPEKTQMANLAAATPTPTPDTPSPTPETAAATGASPTPEPLALAKAEQPQSLGEPGATARVETGSVPGVPVDIMPLAREAKDKFEQGDYREAEKTYERMLSKAPNNVYVLSNLGVVRFRAGKLKLAEEAFKKAIAVAPDDSFSHTTLGIVYYSQGKHDEAVNELTKALAIDPKNPTAHNYLGITASQKGWQEAAQKELETAIALDPNYADAQFNLAVIYATQQPPNKEQARKLYKRATELGAEPDPSLEQLIK